MLPALASDFRIRLVSSLVLAAFAIFFGWLGGLWFALLMTLIAAIMLWEWTVMTLRVIDIRRDVLAFVCILSLIASMLIARSITPIILSLALVAAGGLTVRFFEKKSGWSIAAIGIASGLPLCLIYLRTYPDEQGLGLNLLVFLCFTVWAADIFAYLVGRAVGGPKLMPKVSPKKTWSGFVGGVLGAILIGSLVAEYCFGGATLRLALIAFLLSLVAQAGDLMESAIKRRFNVKDASNLIPGHGGLLDRVDGLTLAAYAFALICAIAFPIEA
ncbi:MAG: phosphatidate cytidylyltransferase [Rhizobiales bacterium]|nr:phosphatidate cytidylyltransferase [Hyphomicrobiales bacterium]